MVPLDGAVALRTILIVCSVSLQGVFREKYDVFLDILWIVAELAD